VRSAAIPFDGSVCLTSRDSATAQDDAKSGGASTTTPAWIWGIVAAAVVVVGAVVVVVVILFRRKKAPPTTETRFDPLMHFFSEMNRAEAAAINHQFENPLCDDSDRATGVEGSDIEEMLLDEHGDDV
jgi:hypothetical protein